MWQLFLQPLHVVTSLVGIPLSIYFSLCWIFMYLGAYFIKMMFDAEKLQTDVYFGWVISCLLLFTVAPSVWLFAYGLGWLEWYIKSS